MNSISNFVHKSWGDISHKFLNFNTSKGYFWLQTIHADVCNGNFTRRVQLCKVLNEFYTGCSLCSICNHEREVWNLILLDESPCIFWHHATSMVPAAPYLFCVLPFYNLDPCQGHLTRWEQAELKVCCILNKVYFTGHIVVSIVNTTHRMLLL